MTIEIKQLVIRAVVDGRATPPRSASEGPQRGVPEPRRPDSPTVAEPVDTTAIVTACVREVMRELRKARER